MDYLKSTLSRVVLRKDIPPFPYNFGEKVVEYDNLSIWELFRGTKKEDGSDVSIFTFDCTKQTYWIPLARNAFKKMRTIRHPDLLRYVDGVETESYIYIVTDYVVPLKSQSSSLSDDNLKLWGLYKVANALKFLNNDCSIVHGNVRISSIFTNKAGEWKLGGFELMSSSKEEDPIIYTSGGYLPDSSRYSSPEITKSSWNILRDYEIWVTDAWNYGTLIYEAYNGPFTSVDQLQNAGEIPQAIYIEYKDLINQNPQFRTNISVFMENGLRVGGIFQNDLVQVNLFLENMNIKEASEKIAFIKKLNDSIDTFPENICKYKILPELLNALEFGAGGVKVIGPIIKIGKTLSQDEYDQYISTAIIKMFALPDRTMRLNLLENLPAFIERFNNKTVTEKIFPHIATGFSDTAPVIREMTVKSVLLLAPKLMKSPVLERTRQFVWTRGKVLVPAFTRALRDPFPHARAASLMALTATVEYYDKVDCATKILPCVSLILIDLEKSVRVQAFKTFDAFVKRLEKLVDTMAETAPPPPPAGLPGVAQAAGGVAGAVASAAETWGGWAVTSLSKKLVGSGETTGNISEPPTPSHPPRTSSSPVNGTTNSTRNESESINNSSSRPLSASNSNSNNNNSSTSNTSNGWEHDDTLIDFGGGLIFFENNTKKKETNDWDGFQSSFPPLAPTTVNGGAKPGNIGGTNSLNSMKLGSSNNIGLKVSNDLFDFDNDFFNAVNTNADNDDDWGGFHQSPSASSVSLSLSQRPVSGISSNFGSSQLTPTSATSSMKLGSKTISSDGWNFDDSGWGDNWGDSSSPTIQRLPPPPSNNLSREEKAAEMNRKREERRQRMGELREQKKKGSGLGARKI
ncbi:12769_t:CDS:10 [Ambispora leptoticha]|uniref:12769_t:CDS:1 n=1 Tax=Ambispora leptoticha TaxID=144679 RepID=A0A9N9A1P6_9GLOM|nr:12769_t:CDS:10 [Ambispora leptoticha]